jgi:hypothetical protein
MNLINKPSKGIAAALAVGLVSITAPLAASANTVNINTVTGIWSDVDPDNVVGITGVGSSVISWGTGSPLQSGYTFVGNAPQPNVSSPFTVGTFTHNNFPISATPTPPSITGATLDVTVMGDVDGTMFTLVSQFIFDHDETSNTCTPQPSCANDIVTLVSGSFGSDTVNIGGLEYVFNISGFTSGISFSTVEGQANTTDLIGEFIVNPVNVIPLPAAAWMLLAGIGGLAAVGRRKKRADA